jgi:hypothetical protein
MKQGQNGNWRKYGGKDEKIGRAGLGVDFVGRKGADHADENADKNTYD